MVRKEKNTKTGKLLTFVFFTLVILVAIVYLLRNKEEQQDGNDSGQTEAAENLNGKVETVIDGNAPEEQIQTKTPRKVQVFIDKDRDQNLTAGEEVCAHCRDMEFIAVEVSYGEDYPSEEKMSILNVKDQGILDENELMVVNSIWGYSAEKDLLIPETSVAINDGSGDLNIPVWEVDVNLSGVNANISQIDWDKETNIIIIELSKLIPSLQTRFEKNEDVWVAFYPNKENSEKIYLGEGKIKKDTTSEITETQTIYYLELNWPLPDQYSDVMDKKNISFILF